MPKYISVAEAARRANRTKATVHRWINDGMLPAVKLGDHANSPVYLDEAHFDRVMPEVLEEMQLRFETRGSRKKNVRATVLKAKKGGTE